MHIIKALPLVPWLLCACSTDPSSAAGALPAGKVVDQAKPMAVPPKIAAPPATSLQPSVNATKVDALLGGGGAGGLGGLVMSSDKPEDKPDKPDKPDKLDLAGVAPTVGKEPPPHKEPPPKLTATGVAPSLGALKPSGVAQTPGALVNPPKPGM